MNFLGLGWEEIVFLLVLALVLFSPKDVQRVSKAIGRGLSRLSRSETWRLIRQTGEELQTLPNRLIREAAWEEQREARESEAVPPLPEQESPTASVSKSETFRTPPAERF